MRPNKTLLTLGSRIREQRLKQELTQEALADSAGIATQLLSAIERGTEDLPLETLLRLATSLHTTAAELCDGIDD
ncbi:MAG: helix-turn-helix domain-containing protein [Chthoniobacterales bacterium]